MEEEHSTTPDQVAAANLVPTPIQQDSNGAVDGEEKEESSHGGGYGSDPLLLASTQQQQQQPNVEDDPPHIKSMTDDKAKNGADAADAALLTDLAKETIPLLYYTRVQGSGIPRPPPPPPSSSSNNNGQTTTATMSLPFQTQCTCSMMGRILLSSENVVNPPAAAVALSSSSHQNNNNTTTTTTTIANNATVATQNDEVPVMTRLQQYLPHVKTSSDGGGPDQPVELYVAVLGLANGTVVILDAQTQALVATLALRETTGTLSSSSSSSKPQHAVVALSMDATGTFLAAVDAGGMCAILELTRFQIQPTGSSSSSSSSTATATAEQQEATANVPRQGDSSNVFTSFMSAFTGGGGGSKSSGTTTTTTSNTSPTAAATRQQATNTTPTLSVISWQTHRIPYPRNFGTPTTVALDPAYKRRREKAVMVGFADGRLVQSKRGLIFQRRTDAVLHQALPAAPQDATKIAPGIQSLVWRGSLVAWAEPSGIRLFDADNLTRIAHVDRPVGARPSLYPSVQSMTARLCFETAHRLLVAWGDCLLQLTIHESSNSPSSAVASTAATGAGTEHGANPTTSEGSPVLVRKRTVECTMAWELDCIAAGVAPLDEKHVMVLGLVPNNEVENNINAADDDAIENEVELQVLSRSDGNVVYSDLLPMLKCPPEAKPKRGRNNNNKATESIAPFAILSTFNIPRMGNVAEIQTGEAMGPEFDPVALFAGGGATRTKFRDSHLQWDLSHVPSDPGTTGDENNREEKEEDGESNDDMDDDSAGSIDSDDYSFVERPFLMDSTSLKIASPPTMWIVSAADAVSARVRNLDDVISAVHDRPAVALQLGLCRRSELRRYKLNDLVNGYFAAVLWLSSSVDKRLSLRRMKLAASAMPVLLGGNPDLWQRWISELEDLPGALFILRSVLPVRDPVLSRGCYTGIVRKMFEQILQMKASSETTKVLERLVGEAENHFLFTLLGWGTSLGIREHLQHYKYLHGLYPNYRAMLVTMEEMAKRREAQSAAVYLSFPVEYFEIPSEPCGLEYQAPGDVDELRDSLYDTEELTSYFEASLENLQIKTEDNGGRAALDALAKLKIGRGQYDAALKYFLLLGSRYGSLSLDEIENCAIKSVEEDMKPVSPRKSPYAFVLSLVETKHLHQILLDKTFLGSESPVPPLIALIQLVGTELAADFLTKHCVAVQSEKTRSGKLPTGGERRGTLPLDIVANQLEASPKILYWYLQCIFLWKPEIYVNFPNTANPPQSVTRLHRKALDLYIKYAGSKRDSVNVLHGVEAYRVSEITTPLLSFLKPVLQLGGVNPSEVAKLLQVERKGGPGTSGVFALELAHIMDHHGEQSKENANIVLELYLHGAQSLMLAVSFAQRAKEHKAELWQKLIDHCLANDKNKIKGGNVTNRNLFGSLLEAAALSGADLAHLVTRIPPGMSIEGLRPRLVGAVSDYRWKLRMHESANEVARKEILDLYREHEHRSRRGKRYEPSDRIAAPGWVKLAKEPESSKPKEKGTSSQSVLKQELRPKVRPQRFHLSYTLSMR